MSVIIEISGTPKQVSSQLRDGLIRAGADPDEAGIAADLSVAAVQEALAKITDKLSLIRSPGLNLALLPAVFTMLSEMAKQRADDASTMGQAALLGRDTDTPPDEAVALVAQVMGITPEQVRADFEHWVKTGEHIIEGI
jgi:hypothetical protein